MEIKVGFLELENGLKHYYAEKMGVDAEFLTNIFFDFKQLVTGEFVNENDQDETRWLTIKFKVYGYEVKDFTDDSTFVFDVLKSWFKASLKIEKELNIFEIANIDVDKDKITVFFEI